MKIFCYVPKICLSESESVSVQVRTQLALALASGCKPGSCPRDLKSAVVDLPPEHLEPVQILSDQLGMAPGRVVGALLYAFHLVGKSERTGSEALVPNVSGLRPGQIRSMQEAAPLLRQGRVVLVEAGTGSGKSRLLAHAAAYMLALRDAGRDPPLPRVSLELGDAGELPLFLRKYAAQAQEVLKQRQAAVHNKPILNRSAKPPQPKQKANSNKSGRAVILCAPSIANISHLVREWEAVRPTLDPQRLRRCTVVLGRSQFISASLLDTFLQEQMQEKKGASLDGVGSDEHDAAEAISDAGCLDAVKKWLDAGMPAGHTAATTHLQSMVPTLVGMSADLDALTQGTRYTNAAQDCLLDEDAPEADQACYHAMRESAMNADLVITTHAMLCMDNMRLATSSDPLLPMPLAVFVDEAHSLEQTQASVAAKSLAFSRLLTAMRSSVWHELRHDAQAKSAASTVRQLTGMLANIPNESALPLTAATSDDNTAVKDWQAALPVLAELAAKLGKMLVRPKSGAGSKIEPGRDYRYVERAKHVLQNMVDGYRGYITHSPARGALSFTIGPPSVERYACARWATTPCVMLTSGTLLYIGATGATPTPLLRELAIDLARSSVTQPVHPSWIYNTPTLLQPDKAIFHKFIPPSGGDEAQPEAMAYWLSEVAKVVALAASDAAGGTLVLLSGYERLAGLAVAIRSHQQSSHMASRLIVQNRHQGAAACIGQFKTAARAGLKPIWLATGSAWTGLDLADDHLSDDRAAEDILLTDLIMPNVPFGLIRTTTHVARVKRTGFGSEAIVTQRQFRQGLGRGVRREGLKYRRLWVLDGRLQHPASAGYTSDLRRVLTAYIHQKAFTV